MINVMQILKILKKKEVWQKISENLRNMYEVDMSAEEIEKRWSSLRDMFSKENRRQKLPPSGSGYEPTKEWELYRNILFLIPHVAHRKTKTSFVLTQNLQSQSSSCTSSFDTNTTLSKQSSNSIISLPLDHDYNGSFQLTEENRPSLDVENKGNISIDNKILKRLASTFTSCSISSNSMQPSMSFNSMNLKNQPTFKPIKKIIPEMDQFAKRRKNKDDEIDNDLMEASKEISAAVKVVSSQMCDQKRYEKDGYMFAIEEGLKYVPLRNKTQCVIEVLQVIHKYEGREQ